MLNSTCRTIKVCKLLQIVNFDGWTFLAALVLYIQSDYLNHSNRDSDWLIVACFMREYRACWRRCCSLYKKSLFWKFKVMFGEFKGFFIIIKQIENLADSATALAQLLTLIKHTLSVNVSARYMRTLSKRMSSLILLQFILTSDFYEKWTSSHS